MNVTKKSFCASGKAPQETWGTSHNTLIPTPFRNILIGKGGGKAQPKLSLRVPERLMHYVLTPESVGVMDERVELK